MNYQHIPRVSEQVISVPANPDFQYDIESPQTTNWILLEMLSELKIIRYRLDGIHSETMRDGPAL